MFFVNYWAFLDLKDGTKYNNKAKRSGLGRLEQEEDLPVRIITMTMGALFTITGIYLVANGGLMFMSVAFIVGLGLWWPESWSAFLIAAIEAKTK